MVGANRVDSKLNNLAFQYDANNRQKQSSAVDGSGAVVSVYDAGGQRVATQVNSQLTNVLVYDASGKLVAEYGSAPAEANGTQFVTADHQGSPRAITNSSGAVVSRHDYAPFGEELPANVGMRSTPQGHSQPDAMRQKYAGMESDDGTGLSHTLWRQYDSLSARWTAPDPYGGSMTIANPQSFNRYAYVGNDPVNHVDPLGLALQDIGVIQTDDPEEARTGERKSLADLQRSVNSDYAARNGGSVTYRSDGRAIPWPPGTHDQIFDTALPHLRNEWMDEMKRGSQSIDVDETTGFPITLIPELAWQHGMVPGPWVAEYIRAGFSAEQAVAKARILTGATNASVIANETQDGEVCHVIRAELSGVPWLLWVGRESFLLRKTRTIYSAKPFDPSGRYTIKDSVVAEELHTKIRLNKPIPDKVFRFKPRIKRRDHDLTK